MEWGFEKQLESGGIMLQTKCLLKWEMGKE